MCDEKSDIKPQTKQKVNLTSFATLLQTEWNEAEYVDVSFNNLSDGLLLPGQLSVVSYLSELNMAYCFLEASTLNIILTATPNLRVLDLRYNTLHPGSDVIELPFRLLELALTFSQKMVLSSVTSQCAKLRKLTLDQFFSLVDSATWRALGDELVQVLQQLPNLHDVSILEKARSGDERPADWSAKVSKLVDNHQITTKQSVEFPWRRLRLSS